MFVLLLGMPLLPLGDHGWLWFPLLLILAVLFQAIVRDVVEIYGGSVELDESEDLGGLLVKLRLPRAAEG